MSIERIGLIGLGLMGRSIAACLLSRGFCVTAYNKDQQKYDEARPHIEGELRELVERAQFPASILDNWQERIVMAQSIEQLSDCPFVIESIFENVQAKQQLFDELEKVIAPKVPVGSNTSAIPISIIQKPRTHPQRFFGMHWSEPAHNTRFMELIRGEQTDDATMAIAIDVAKRCGKDPSIVKNDIRGFITNRLMYALMREALHLLDNGYADVESIDRSFRNDIGWFATLAGPFRMMDMTGLPAYIAVMKDLFPELATTTQLPETMQRLADEGANGVFNGHGFYDYTPEQSQHWQKMWAEFSWDARRLAEKYTPLED